MKSLIRNFLLPVAGLALAATCFTATSANAANWPPVNGDLVLGVQATTGQGATTNVFFNLGSATALRDSPSPGLVANLDVELQAAFGAAWATRTDLYFGVIAVRTNTQPSGLGSQAPVNGDPGRTIYASKGTATAGSATPWSGFSVSSLGTAANSVVGMVDAIDNLTANANQVLTLVQASNPVQWNAGWSAYNVVPGPGFSIFTGGIQAQMSGSGAIVDLFRIVGSSGVGSYITSITLGTDGGVTINRVGGAASFFTVSTSTATNGIITGADGVTLYASGTNAFLRAVPNSGFGFVNFTGDLSGSTNPRNLPVDGNKSVGAVFAPFPSVTSPTATSITDVSATLGGNVTSDGGQAVTVRGVVFAPVALNPNPQLEGSNVTDLPGTSGTGVFELPASGLTGGTTYAFAAYATSAAGTGYSSVARFTTDTTVNFTNGIGTVSGRSLLAGDTQRFNLSIASPTNVQFSSTGATDLSWELRNSSNGLVSSGTGSVNVASLLAAGSYSLTLTSTGAGAQSVSLLLNASNVATARPDVTVGATAAATTGNNVYAPAAQRVTIISKKAAAKNGFARVGNDGALPDRVRVSATAGNKFFKVTYFAPGNVTASITRNAFLTPVLSSSSAPVSIRANVAPVKKQIVKKRGKRTTYLKKTFTSTIRGTALSSSARFDAAQIIVKTQ